ncbi:hypothetical protein [Pontixanthobacter aquaemixtae]|uniref:Glycosyltransferase RgtA/B/C/D-like domain-containing protein n=1 Tax=Pontixanthobacter aquaemixtae TaxID=1958940 RepID=A0A844ZS86_9SPHN|nr:hypothetical protein [Pontixanthobacter aquaemixtae]MXO89667.1 hypothetical protein [Pontixanthobacter aquaemixtae]
MASHAPTLDVPAKRSSTLEAKWLIFAALFLVAVQVELLFAKSINWDEFFHFSQIHASLRGEPVQWLQTPHVTLFGWVPALPGTPIDHILLTRLLLLPCSLVTGLAIFDIARRFTNNLSAALAALAFAGGGYVFLHAFALRADMIAAALLTGALWILATRRRTMLWAAVAALLCGLATIATIKSVLYAPALMAMAAWRWQDRIQAGTLAMVAAAAIALAAAGWLLVPADIVQSFTGLAGSSLRRMFSAGLFPQGRFFIDQMIFAPVLTAFILCTIIAALRGDRTMPWWLLSGLIAPLAWVLIYRNAYPYFYAFILPPVAIAAAIGASVIIERYSAKITLAVIIANAVLLSATQPREMLDRQRAVQDGISEIFPSPTRYIDDIAFRPDFPRAVPHFASGWALANYRRKGTPIYTAAMDNPPAPFLFRQGYALEVLDPAEDDINALLPQDAKALRDNYIPHWGRVYVAGKSIPASTEFQTIELLIPGFYTVEGTALTIDGALHPVGSVIRLDRGSYSVGPLSEAATLRWGDNLPIPAEPFPAGALFTVY